MPDRLIERVAASLHEALGNEVHLREPWGKLVGQRSYQERIRHLARAAIAGMREPTDRMVSAASGSAAGTYSFEERAIDWRAMIDAALAEEE